MNATRKTAPKVFALLSPSAIPCHNYLQENEICTDHNERCPYGYICAQPYPGAEDRCVSNSTVLNQETSGLYEMNTCYDTKLPPGEKAFKECTSDDDCVVIKVFNGEETNIKGTCSSGREKKCDVRLC